MTRNLKKLKDSSHRKETKEEKRKRLQNARESREVRGRQSSFARRDAARCGMSHNDHFLVSDSLLTRPSLLCNILQQCLKILPYVGGGLFAVMLLFALYVQTLPPPVPRARPQKIKLTDNLGPDGVVKEMVQPKTEDVQEKVEEEKVEDDDSEDDEDSDLEETRGDL